jgi:hypothetical protein
MDGCVMWWMCDGMDVQWDGCAMGCAMDVIGCAMDVMGCAMDV